LNSKNKVPRGIFIPVLQNMPQNIHHIHGSSAAVYSVLSLSNCRLCFGQCGNSHTNK